MAGKFSNIVEGTEKVNPYSFSFFDRVRDFCNDLVFFFFVSLQFTTCYEELAMARA